MSLPIAVVTGASSGIGLETTKKFLADGYEVIGLDRNDCPLATRSIQVDLSDSESIDRAVLQLPEKFDVLCNIAGVAGTSGARLVLAVCFLGLRRLTELAADRIVDGGSVVNVASTSGWYWKDHLNDVEALIASATPDEALRALGLTEGDGYEAYNKAKETVIVWSALAAQRYQGRFRVNSVSPGVTETPLLAEFFSSMGVDELDPLLRRSGRSGTAVEIANLIWSLAQPSCSWVNGSDIVADNGAEVFLWLQDQIPDTVKNFDPYLATGQDLVASTESQS